MEHDQLDLLADVGILTRAVRGTEIHYTITKLGEKLLTPKIEEAPIPPYRLQKVREEFADIHDTLRWGGYFVDVYQGTVLETKRIWVIYAHGANAGIRQLCARKCVERLSRIDAASGRYFAHPDKNFNYLRDPDGQ